METGDGVRIGGRAGVDGTWEGEGGLMVVSATRWWYGIVYRCVWGVVGIVVVVGGVVVG